MEAVPRLPMISCDIKISPSNTDFGHTLRKYIRDFYHEEPDSYTKEIKELETLRLNAIKAPMDFTGCSILKRYYSQLHKLQSRFPMTDDGPACVPFMWTDIYSGVAYNITDIEYEEACILYNIGALHSKLGTMDSRCNAEGMKIACTHFQCAAWAYQHLRDTYPQPKGSDMSHDLLTFFINIMLAQAQECILEKSMLDSRKSSITAKIAAQVVDYYKCALGIMVSGSPSTDTGSILDIVGSKIFKAWKKFIEFKMSYYGSISHLYMGNQAEEHEKWGERVAWFQSANDHLTEAFKIAKNIDREDLNEPLAFTMDVIGGKLNSSKKENEFVYHDKVPVLSSLPELKGASLVKGIPFSITDPDVSGPDIFARLVPMEAHETSSLYSEEKAKVLRSVVSKIERKNEELMAYLSSLQLESEMSFEEEKIPQDLVETCAAMSVRPTAITDLQELMKELIEVSKDVDGALKSSFAYLTEEERRELKHQEVFGKRSPSLLMMELKKECTKYDEAHKKAVESNNTLETAVNIHINNMRQLYLPLKEIAEMLPSTNAVKTPENVKAMEDFNHLIKKVDEMKTQRIFLEEQLREALVKDDITVDLVTMKKKDLQQVFEEELEKHTEVLTYLDQNLSAQDNILRALTEANAQYADTRKVITEINRQREEMVNALVNSFDAYDDIVSKAKKGMEFYKKLQTNVSRLLTRIRGVTKVQEEERAQIAEVRNGPRIAKNPHYPAEPHVPKLKDYLPYLSKDGGKGTPLIPPNLLNAYVSHHTQIPATQVEPMRQATMGGPSTEFNRKLKPISSDNVFPKENFEPQSIGIRPTPVGSEQPTVPAMCTTTVTNSEVGNFPYSSTRQSPLSGVASTTFSSNFGSPQLPYQYANSSAPTSQITSPHSLPPNANLGAIKGQNIMYNGEMLASNTGSSSIDYNRVNAYQLPASITAVPQNFTSLSAIPSIPSQVNSSYAPTTPSSVHPAAPSKQNIMQSGFQPSLNNYTSNASSNSGTVTYPVSSAGFTPNSNMIPPFVPSQASGGSTLQQPPHISMTSGSMPYTASSAEFANASGIAPHFVPPATLPGANLQQPFAGGSLEKGSLSYPTHSSGIVPVSTMTSNFNPSLAGNNLQHPQTGINFQHMHTGSNFQHAHTGSSITPRSTSQPVMPQSMQPVSVGGISMPPTSTLNNMTLTNIGMPYTTRYQTGQTNTTNLPVSQQSVITQPGHNIPQSTGQVPNWQNPAQLNQYVRDSGYNMQPQVVQPKFTANSSLQSGIPPNQYYQGNVTASLDTKTSTLNTANQYPLASPNVTSQTGHNANYVTNLPGVTTYPNANPVNTSSNTLPQNYSNNFKTNNYSNYGGLPVSSGNVYSTPVPNSSQNNYGVPYNQTNYYPGMQPQTVYSGAISNTTSPVLQNMGPQSSNVQFPSQNPVPSPVTNYANQQNYQPPVNSSIPYNASTSAFHHPSNPANQIVPMPTESKSPSPSASLQPLPPVATQISVDQKTRPENSQPNAIRDLITPPLEMESSKDSEKESESTFPPVLQPKVIDLKELSQLKEKEAAHLVKDPLDDTSVRSKFVSEVEKYEKFVDGLLRKSLNGTTPLDQKWKELIDAQDKESRKMSISVARCYPLKNRYPDVMPYDNNRVKLTSAKDDYINASYLKDICSGSPVFVITQAPLPSTFNDFWLMVWEQQVETLICLLSDSELKNHVYFPKERGQTLPCGAFETSLHSCKEKNGFVERMVNITYTKNRTSRVVVHLQFTQWPASGIPISPAPLLQFISDVLSYQKQQRNLMRPVVVHCSSGIGRSGCFCLVTALVNEMNNGHGPRDVAQVATMVSQQRKFLVQDKDQLKFCYDSVLYYAQDLLMKRGILTSRASFDDKLPGSGNTTSHVRHPSEDFILGSGGLAKLQSGIENMTMSTDQKDTSGIETSSEISKCESQTIGDGASLVLTTAVDSDLNVSPQPSEEQNGNGEAGAESANDKVEETKSLTSITSLLDPSNFTLDGTGSPAKRKITKENFANSKGSLSTSSSDSADPLSLLDPLWSLKK